MGYSAQTFVAGEQPTTAKWNLLWGNDASFNDGSGLAFSAAGVPIQLAANPYNFKVFRNNAFNATSTPTAIAFDNVLYDVGSNVSLSTGIYTCKASGKYTFSARSGIAVSSGNEVLVTLVKAGSASESSDGNRGISTNTQSGLIASIINTDFSLVLNDTVQVNIYSNSTVAAQAGQTTTWFSGHMISKT